LIELLYEAAEFVVSDPKLVVVRALRQLNIYTKKDQVNFPLIYANIATAPVAARDNDGAEFTVLFAETVNWQQQVRNCTFFL